MIAVLFALVNKFNKKRSAVIKIECLFFFVDSYPDLLIFNGFWVFVLSVK